jgi:hypothetical protein
MEGMCVFCMSRGIRIAPNVKTEIVNKIRDGGLSVVDASATYNVSSKTIYTWLKDGVVDGNRNLILENNKLRKELEIAYRLLGRATAEMQYPKK